MADKKNEDYVVRMPESDAFSEKGFSSRSSTYSSRVGHGSAAPLNINQLDNSPGLSILAYCLASISMTVVNKYVVSGSAWNLNFLYLAIQSTVCILAILFGKQVGLIKHLSPFDPEKGKRWFPISLLLVGMIYTGAKALQFLSVPVYTIFKNLTIIVIAYGEVLWFGGQVSPITLLSFGLMVLSSIIAAWADIQAALNSVGHTAAATEAISTLNAGYAWMGLNVFCSASFVLGMRKVIKKMNFKDKDTMFYNNLLSIPILVVCSLLLEDWSSENLERNFPVETRTKLLIGMVYSGLAAIFISYCSAWCVRVTSSTTYSMVGALNKLPIAVSGLVFFDAPITFGSVAAIALGFVSGLVYAWAKVRQSVKPSESLPMQQPVMSASSQSSKDASNA
ncbi:golgi GDP-mannose transporter [Grosmannia clavigera kw1407]|uniref:GDP-mannose transporter n=1 Tax=Grosmannia clavigera (strain kw1407 / UAMH 11150) TaxID=655863 RepID=F0XPR1_GROCL|nr:golgi GDP-mannose transporter [Grosmannia clavigera kw1407]EFX00580.1 golgi GDP-mannose transporter [Grosmannia clavigera kw1407]